MTAILAEGQTFALRIWTEDLGEGGVEWRAKVRHLPSGETRYFREWEVLLQFLQSKLEGGLLSPAPEQSEIESMRNT